MFVKNSENIYNFDKFYGFYEAGNIYLQVKPDRSDDDIELFCADNSDILIEVKDYDDGTAIGKRQCVCWHFGDKEKEKYDYYLTSKQVAQYVIAQITKAMNDGMKCLDITPYEVSSQLNDEYKYAYKSIVSSYLEIGNKPIIEDEESYER